MHVFKSEGYSRNVIFNHLELRKKKLKISFSTSQPGVEPPLIGKVNDSVRG